MTRVELLENEVQCLRIENKAYRAALKSCNDIAFQKSYSAERMMSMWHVISNTLKEFKQ